MTTSSRIPCVLTGTDSGVDHGVGKVGNGVERRTAVAVINADPMIVP